MKIKVSSDIVKNLGKEYTPIQNKEGTLVGTFTEDDEQFISILVEGNCWDIPRKYCSILVGKSLTNALQ